MRNPVGTTTTPRGKGGKKRIAIMTILVAVLLFSVAFLTTFMIVKNMNKGKEAATQQSWGLVGYQYVDGGQGDVDLGESENAPYVNRMLYEHRFTRAWDSLLPDSYPVSSRESKEAYLAAIAWSDESGVSHFNPLALIGCLEAWRPELLEGVANASQFLNLIKQDEKGNWYASDIGRKLFQEYEDFIRDDDIFVSTNEAPESYFNSGSSHAGVVYSAKSGIGGNRTAWFIVHQSELKSAKETAQLTRCGNPARKNVPVGRSIGLTDNDRPTVGTPPKVVAGPQTPQRGVKVTGQPSYHPTTVTTHSGGSSGGGGGGGSKATSTPKGPTKVPQVGVDTPQGKSDQGKQASDNVPATKPANPRPSNPTPSPNPPPPNTGTVGKATGGGTGKTMSNSSGNTSATLPKAGDPPKGNNSSPDKLGGDAPAPANGSISTDSSGERTSPGVSDNGGTLSGGQIE